MTTEHTLHSLAPKRDTFVRHALERFPLTHPRTEHVADSFNSIYRVTALEGVYALRVNDTVIIHHPLAPVAEESWTADLAAAGISAPRIIRTKDNALVVGNPRSGSTRASLLTWMPGSSATQPLDGGRIIELGDLSARLHAASPTRATRPPGVLDARNPLLFEIPDVLHTAPYPHRSVLRTAAQRTRDWLNQYWDTIDEPPRILHFDLTPGNTVASHDGTLAVIDCEDLAWGHRQQDIANTLYGISRGVVHGDVVELFRRGYERHADWPHIDDRDLALLFVARRLTMTNLALTLKRPALSEYVARHARAIALTAQ